jgi:hypothetical protein
MLRGYWSVQWQHEYKQTYEEPDKETRKERNKRSLQMGRWQKQLIKTIWGSMIKLWKTRNNKRHGWDKESRDLARQEVLHKELEDLYDRKNEYPQRVQRLLRGSYDIHIQDVVSRLTTPPAEVALITAAVVGLAVRKGVPQTALVTTKNRVPGFFFFVLTG